jgi:hypothetical protein
MGRAGGVGGGSGIALSRAVLLQEMPTGGERGQQEHGVSEANKVVGPVGVDESLYWMI